MPQMAPYNWLLLNFYFSMIFLMYIILMNFMPMKKFFKNLPTTKKNFLIKW